MPNRLMETQLYFRSNPETRPIIERLIDMFEVSDNATSFSIAVNLRDGDVTTHIFFPGPPIHLKHVKESDSCT